MPKNKKCLFQTHLLPDEYVVHDCGTAEDDSHPDDDGRYDGWSRLKVEKRVQDDA
jgi:hypothetical protein